MFLPNLKTANILNLKLFVGVVFIFFIFVNTNLLSSKVEAAGMYLNPATGSILTSTFELTVSLDSESTSNVKGIDSYITFDQSLVQVERIDKIGLITSSTATYNNSQGTIHIKGDFEQTPGAGAILNFAKIYLSVKPNSRGKPVSFTFEEGVDSSKILDTSNASVLNKTVGADLLIDVAGVNSTNVVQQSTSTYIPKTGTTNPLLFITMFGFLTVLASFAIRKYAITKL